MCGFAGLLTADGLGRREELVRRAGNMAAAVTHRGPDDEGVWADGDAGVALGHRRLAVIDLSAAGHQPMVSATGRYVVAYNGEIYNYPELRARLEREGAAPAWRGHSDTETLLAAIEAWGFVETLGRLDGMFALALWDRRERSLYLARDRFGEKPLYYGRIEETGEFCFGSELKTFCALPEFSRRIDPTARTRYAAFGYVPAPLSIYAGIRKLTPGAYLTVDADVRKRSAALPTPVRYWSLLDAVERGKRTPFVGGEAEATDELHRLLGASVRRRMISDAPLGVFLSGGIDSSVVTGMMAATGAEVKSFTIGYREGEYDESSDARKVATHFGTRHTEATVSPAEAMGVIPLLPDLYDEPFADSSQIPTFLVSQLARKSVTVSLSGDGGDELFGGYNRHVSGPALWRRIRRLPLSVRQGGAALLGATPSFMWETLERLFPAGWLPRSPRLKAQKMAEILTARSREELYRRLVTQWRHAAPDAGEYAPLFDGGSDDDFALAMTLVDGLTYLPDDILVKVDRAAMGVSLETRAPFLDHELAAFAFSLPLSMKIGGGKGKRIVRSTLARMAPPELFERPKAGFAAPVDDWLRGPLSSWAEGVLFDGAGEPLVERRLLERVWREHRKGDRNHAGRLWTVLMYHTWRDRWTPR